MEKMSPSTNALNWFEIPMTDVERARKFYETILGITLFEMEMMQMTMLNFPPDMTKVGGALVKSEYHKPGKEGVIVYLNANPDLQLVVDKIEAAGGKVTMPKTEISAEIGYMAFFEDTEGNALGLHSGK